MNLPDTTPHRLPTSKWLLLLILSVVFLSSCSDPSDPALKRSQTADADHGAIVVGAVAPWSSIDTMLWEGIDLATSQINAKGGLLHRKIRLIKKDDHGSATDGVRIAQQLAENQNLVAVIGHYQSFVTIPASVIYQYYGIMLLSTIITDPGLTQQGFGLIFRTVPADAAFGRKLAEFCRRKGYQNILVYHDRTAYGRDLANAFEIATEAQGISVIDRETFDSYTRGKQFLRKLRDWQRRYDFDAVLLAGDSTQSALFIKTARENGFDKPILGSIAFDKPYLWKRLGQDADKLYFATPFNRNSRDKRVQAFMAAFRKKYHKAPDAFAIEGYDTVRTLAYAIEHAKSTAPLKMARALRAAPAIHGLTGTFCFYSSGQCDNTNIQIVSIDTAHTQSDSPIRDQSAPYSTLP